MPDVALLVELVGNLVAHNAAALVEASEAHDRELVEFEANPREPSWGTGRFAEKDFAHRKALMRLLSEAPS